MEEIERLILGSKEQKYYRHAIKGFSKSELNDFERLALQLEEAGALDPLGWAFSEIKEGIPQAGRFLVLKGLFDIIKSPEENISLAYDFDEEVEEKYLDIQKLVGEEKLSDFLKTFSKGIISNVIDLLDYGNCNSDGEIGWVLVKTDKEGNLTEKIISGLHEDFLDFEDELKTYK
ncbi:MULTISPECIES: hypothetical protein [Flavobacterium]|uniref:Knr4/Smi1-like domain-containing protein n=1 Tax=Flavobacterium ginsengisoli TaxID=871694 RepID=A0ABP7F5U3_9FLAO|nr:MULTISPECIES: hypothetical protein [Flavobacterium]MBJ2125735.1 hypothetical protein [Flavobacterium sp. IB48]